MKMTLSTSQIANELYADKNAGWTYAGARALAEYLEELEADTGDEIELDVVALRCDFSEYASLEAWAEDYFGGKGEALDGLGLDGATDDLSEHDDKIREHIQNNGQLIEFSGGIIVSSF